MCLTKKDTRGKDTAKSEVKEGRDLGKRPSPGSELGCNAPRFLFRVDFLLEGARSCVGQAPGGTGLEE